MAELIRLSGLTLTPVIELEPGTFAKMEHEYPLKSGDEAPEEWHRYWCESLADSGLTGLTPIQPGAWHVEIREFDIDQVRIVIRTDMQDQVEAAVLCGGMILDAESHGRVITPTCCSDLGNLNEWNNAARYRSDKWDMLWIGHPWVSIMFDGQQLVISDYHESDSPTARWSVDPDELTEATVRAEAEISWFATERIMPVLESLGYAENSVDIANTIAGVV